MTPRGGPRPGAGRKPSTGPTIVTPPFRLAPALIDRGLAGKLAIRGELTGARTFPARYVNTCWSLVDTDDTIKVGGRYEPKPDKITAAETFISKTDETAEHRKQVQTENIGWYAGITADMFT